MLFSIIF